MQKVAFAIVGALEEEIRSLREKMQIEISHDDESCQFIEGRMGEHDVVLVRSGVGSHRVEKALPMFFERYHPGFLLGIGFCGATDPELNVGDLVIADTISVLPKGEEIVLDALQVKKAVSLCEEHRFRYRQGKIVTSPHVVRRQHEKAFLGTSESAIAVDMESFSLLQLTLQYDIPACVVSSVFDPLECELPAVEGTLDSAGRPKPLPFLKFLAADPKQIFKLPELMYSAKKAREVLTHFVEAWIYAKPT